MAKRRGVELLELVCNEKYKPKWRAYKLPRLGPDQVRVRVEFAAAKHGTEMGVVLGTASFMQKQWNGQLNLMLPRTKPHNAKMYVGVGNMFVGSVVATGKSAKRFKVGDRVYAHGRFRTVHQAPEGALHPLVDGLTPEAAMCIDPAEFALAAVRDGQVRLGDRVMVFGMGAIGLFAVQMARLSGATDVVAIDPLESRRELAIQHGATDVLDPTDGTDIGLWSREKFGGQGPDVTIEASGSHRALHESIRCAAFGGRVVPLAYYLGEARGLCLGDEFHFNRVTILSARACSDPNREYPIWDDRRIVRTCTELFARGVLKPHGLPAPIVGPDELPEAYGQILHAPAEVVKVAVRFV